MTSSEKIMTQEHKELLLKDLCSRLPYGVKMNHIADDEHSPKILIGIAKDMITLKGLGGYEYVDVEHYKPYLFPLSSMTEEQEELNKKFNVQLLGNNIYIYNHSQGYWDTDLDVGLQDWLWLINWCYKNHFDINGLIDLGLANDATGLNIY